MTKRSASSLLFSALILFAPTSFASGSACMANPTIREDSVRFLNAQAQTPVQLSEDFFFLVPVILGMLANFDMVATPEGMKMAAAFTISACNPATGAVEFLGGQVRTADLTPPLQVEAGDSPCFGAESGAIKKLVELENKLTSGLIQPADVTFVAWEHGETPDGSLRLAGSFFPANGASPELFGGWATCETSAKSYNIEHYWHISERRLFISTEKPPAL